MDPALWGNLPDHVLDHVLVQLPLPVLSRFRCVCRRFYSLSASRSFLKSYPVSLSPVSFPQPWLVHTYAAASNAYNPAANNWFELSPYFIPDPWFSNVMASMSGLVLLSPLAKGACRPVRIVVFNPYTGFEKRLPPIGHPSAAQMLVDPSGDNYQIFAICEDPDSEEERERWLLHRYTSSSNGWGVLSSQLPIGIFPGSATIDVCNGIVYCTVGYRTPQFGIWAFDMAERRWSRVRLPFLPSYARCQLVSCGKRLMLITRMKDEMAVQNDNCRGSFSCCAQGDLLYIISGATREINVTVFNLATKNVQYAPPLVAAVNSSKTFPFYPRLSTLV
uniref:F-box domain-containing protein n=1 Tax=Physcomitrium patens TaxID=3218 RepID=A0A2K1JU60_PHYPA|nr:hypothetical protein PHYPA_014830 [Physcomitrium patens]